MPITPPRPPAQHYTNTGKSGIAPTGIGTTLGAIAGGPVGAAVGTVAETILMQAFGGDKGPGFQTQLNDALTWQRKTGEMDSRLKWQHAKDAQKYGFHPLAGLGINPASGTTLGYMRGDVASTMGQNISRAIGGTIRGAKQKQLEELALERAQLENDLIRAQISDVTSPGDGPGFIEEPDINIKPSKNDEGLTAGSDKPPPAAKKLKVGDTPYGPVHINLPPSGQADEYGEVYGAIKGLEYMAKRGYVYYSNGTWKAAKKLRKMLGRD